MNGALQTFARREKQNRAGNKRKTVGQGGEKEGEEEEANRQCGSMSIDYPLYRIDRADPVGEKLGKKKHAERVNERKEREGVENSESFHVKTR